MYTASSISPVSAVSVVYQPAKKKLASEESILYNYEYQYELFPVHLPLCNDVREYSGSRCDEDLIWTNANSSMAWHSTAK